MTYMDDITTFHDVHRLARQLRHSAAIAADQTHPQMGEITLLLTETDIEALEQQADRLEEWLSNQY